MTEALHRQAAFSPCGRHRWWLERRWDLQRPRLLFIGLNPSRADDQRDDLTLRITASRAVLPRSQEPVGAGNDAWMRERVASLQPGDAVWLGWGNGGGWLARDRVVLALLQGALHADTPLLAVALTAAGQPRHPLYVPAAAQPQRLQHPGEVLRFAAPH